MCSLEQGCVLSLKCDLIFYNVYKYLVIFTVQFVCVCVCICIYSTHTHTCTYINIHTTVLFSFLSSIPSSLSHTHTHTRSLTPLSFRLISSHTFALTQPALPRSCHPQLSINHTSYFCHINNSVCRCVRERGACNGTRGNVLCFFLSSGLPQPVSGVITKQRMRPKRRGPNG